MAYELRVAASADRALGRLPEKVSAAIVEFITGILLDAPRCVGKPLRQELEGLWTARRGAYRVVYRVFDDEGYVRVEHVEHRADIYRRR